MTHQITLRITVRWWVRPYLHTLALFAETFGFEPDWVKVQRTVARGLVVKIQDGPDGA
jgi:hypothetical protein